jgi:hypothetical protein
MEGGVFQEAIKTFLQGGIFVDIFRFPREVFDFAHSYLAG